MRCKKTLKNFIALVASVLILTVNISPVAYAQTSSTANSFNVISTPAADVAQYEPVTSNSLRFNPASKMVIVQTSEGVRGIDSENVLILNINARTTNTVVANAIKTQDTQSVKAPQKAIATDIAQKLPKTTTSSSANTLVVTTQSIKNLAVTTAKLADGSVTTQKLADLAITMQKIADNAVTTSKLADGSVTGDKIADGSIGMSKLSQLSITAEQIANYTITAEKLAYKSVNSFTLDDYAVITTKIGTQAVTADKLADNSVLNNSIGDGAITTSKIFNNAVDGTKIALGSDALGDIMYYNGTDYVRLPAGTNGQVLGLAGGIPSWGDTTSPISSLTDALTTNTIDNTNFTQTWNWTTATTQNGLEFGANALTTGSVLRISSTNASLNSTRGLLDVANTGSSTSGVVARMQANNTADSGLTVFADGRIGINTNTAGTTLALKQNLNGNVLFNAQRATDVAPSGDFITYWNAAGDTVLYRVDNSGNVYAGGITNSNSITITSTSAPQLRVQYNGGNENTNSVSSAGVTTYGFNGTTPQALFVPQSNRTDTFQFQTAGGLATVLNVDTQNQRVGVGTDAPAATFSVGPTSQFQVDSAGNVTANNIITGGTFTLTGLSPSSMVFTDASSNLITAIMSGDATITTGGVFTISNNAITTGKILDQNVTTNKIADLNVTTGKLADNAITTAKVADLNITTQKIADSAVTALKLATDAVETVKIKDLNVTTAKIDDLAITAGKLAADSVITAKILDSNVTTAKLADFAVTALKLATDAVTTIKIQDGAVTTQKIANNAVDGTKIQLGSDANGDIMYYNGTDYVRLPVGSSSQVLMVSGGIPSWGAGTSPISALTPAVATNSIDNSIYAQTWNWGGMAAGSALSIGITGTTSSDNTALNLTTSSTGTSAYALRVNDDGTYADSTPFVIDKDGNIISGGTSLAASPVTNQRVFRIIGDGAHALLQGFTYSNAPATSSELNLRRARGTASSPSAVQSGDRLGAYFFGGAFDSSGDLSSNQVAVIAGAAENFASGTRGSYLSFETVATGTNSRLERMRIDGQGNVGIGTISPSALFSVGSTSQFQVNSSGAIAAATGISSSGTINFSGLTASKVVFTDASKNLTSTGTVGVDQGGTGTTGLTGLVIGNGASPMSATTLSSGIATQISDETGSGSLVFGTTPVFTTNISTPAIISAGALTVTPAAGQNLNVNLSTTGDFVVNTNQLVVDTSAGNVGIGTASPSYALHVVANAPGSVPFAIQNTSDTGFASMRYFDDAGVQRMSVGYGNANATAAIYREKAYIITYLANPILFVTNSGERMRVTETGTVGIGTQTPGAQLEVKSAAAGNIGLIVAGTAGQTADLQQWKDGSGNIKLAIDASGALYQTPSMIFNTSTIDPNDSTSHLFAIKNSPTIQFNPNAYPASDSFVANQFSPVFDMTGARASGTNFGYNTLYALYTDPAEDQSMANMDLRSLYGYVSHAGNVTLGTATGVAARVVNTGSGTITNARSLWARNVNNTGGGTIGTAYGLYLDNQTAGTTNYAIYSAGGQSYFAGNFAIGATTMSNGSKLDVQSANTTLASGNNIAFIESSDSQAVDKGGSLGFGGQSASGVVTAFGSIAGRKENGTPGSPSGYLQLSSQTSAGTMTEAMRINSFSNIGIGTQSSAILRRVDIKNASGQTGSLTLMNNDFVVNSAGTSMQFATGAVTGDTYYRMQVNNAGQTNPGNLVINDQGGNVGIGTSTPATFKLEVSGNVGPATDNANNLGSAVRRYANVYATTFNGSVTPTGFTQGSVVFAGSGGTLSQNNSAFFWDNTNNRLGIGTGTPTNNIDVVNTTGIARMRMVGSGTSYTQSDIVLQTNTTDTPTSRGTGIYTQNQGNNTTWYTGNPYATPDMFVINRKAGSGFLPETAQSNAAGVSNFLTINNSGYVGIGTAAPNTKIDVLGTQGTITSAIRQLGLGNLYDDSGYAADVGAALTLGGKYNSSGAYSVFGGIKSGKELAADANAAGYLAFHTSAGTGILSEKMRILSNGNVGVGTTSPTTTNGGVDIASGGIGLIVGADASAITRTNSTTKESRIGAPHYTNAEEPLALIVGSSTSTANNIVIGGGTSSMNTATTLFFSTAANTTTTTGSTRMLIDSSGNVGIGIGTNAPSSRLQISAATSASSMTLGSGTGVGLTVSNDNRLYGINFGVGGDGKGWIH